MPQQAALVPVERIAQSILLIRGQKVILDNDLALLYGVPTKVFNQAVRRNCDRFPEDFMFQLSVQEYESLRSQFVTLKTGRGQHRKYLPCVFTQEGVAMLSSVLRSRRAVLVNIEIMRAFVRLRRLLSSNERLARTLGELEKKYEDHDKRFAVVFEAIRDLMAQPEEPPKGKLGFQKRTP